MSRNMTNNKNVEEKRYLRVLTKNIEEMQPQLTSVKKKLKALNDVFDNKISNGDAFIDQNGEKYTFLPEEKERELNEKITEFEKKHKNACKEKEKLKEVKEKQTKELEELMGQINNDTQEKRELKEWLKELKKQEEKVMEEKKKLIEERNDELKYNEDIANQLKERIKASEQELKKLSPKALWK